MRRSDCFQSKYFNGQDVQDIERSQPELLTLTIADVEKHRMEDDSDETKPVMSFRETSRGPVLNPTNFDIIAKVYGEDTDDWRGRRVRLFYDASVQYGGRSRGGVRVKPLGANGTAPVRGAVGGQQTFPVKWADAVMAASDVGISETELKDALKAAGCTKLNEDAGRVISGLIAQRRAQADGSAETPVDEDSIPF